MKINLNTPLLLLVIAFVVLKVTETVDWSWWWVLSPLILGVALYLGLLLMILGGWLFTLIVFALATGKTLTPRPKRFKMPK